MLLWFSLLQRLRAPDRQQASFPAELCIQTEPDQKDVKITAALWCGLQLQALCQQGLKQRHGKRHYGDFEGKNPATNRKHSRLLLCHKLVHSKGTAYFQPSSGVNMDYIERFFHIFLPAMFCTKAPEKPRKQQNMWVSFTGDNNQLYPSQCWCSAPFFVYK